MRDIMSNHELSLLKLQLLLYSTLIAELNLIILSYILIGFVFSPPAQLPVVGRTGSAVPNGKLAVPLCINGRGGWTVLQHWHTGKGHCSLSGDTVKCTKSPITCWRPEAFWDCFSSSCHQDTRVGVPLILWTLKDSINQWDTDWCKVHGLVCILRYSQS